MKRDSFLVEINTIVGLGWTKWGSLIVLEILVFLQLLGKHSHIPSNLLFCGNQWT
jgi:hypothetical protein